MDTIHESVKYGVSMIESARRIYKQLQIVEQSLQNLCEQKVYDVGDKVKTWSGSSGTAPGVIVAVGPTMSSINVGKDQVVLQYEDGFILVDTKKKGQSQEGDKVPVRSIAPTGGPGKVVALGPTHYKIRVGEEQVLVKYDEDGSLYVNDIYMLSSR